MKPTLTMGFFELPYLHKDEKGEMSGPVLPVFRKSFYYVVEKFNVTYEEYSLRDVHRCANNECPFPMKDPNTMVDYIAGLSNLPEINDDITLGPPLTQVRCFLATQPVKKERIGSQSFMSSLIKSDIYTATATIWILIFLALNLRFQANLSPQRTLWLSLRVILQNSILSLKGISVSLILLVIYCGFLKVFIASSVRKNMIKTEDFLKVDTLDSAFAQNLSVSSGSIDCTLLAFGIPDKSVRNKIFAKSDDLFGKADVTDFFARLEEFKSICLLIQQNALDMFIHLGCSTLGNQLMRLEDMYTSRKPVFTTIGKTFLSKNISNQARRTFDGGVYGALEMKLFNEMVSPGLAQIMVGDADFKCANEKAISEQGYFSSLGTQFFHRIFYLYFSTIIFGISLFLSEKFLLFSGIFWMKK